MPKFGNSLRKVSNGTASEKALGDRKGGEGTG